MNANAKPDHAAALKWASNLQGFISKEHDNLAACYLELRELLDPFKRLAGILEPLDLPDDAPIRDCAPGVWPTLGDCRKVCEALKEQP